MAILDIPLYVIIFRTVDYDQGSTITSRCKHIQRRAVSTFWVSSYRAVFEVVFRGQLTIYG